MLLPPMHESGIAHWSGAQTASCNSFSSKEHYHCNGPRQCHLVNTLTWDC